MIDNGQRKGRGNEGPSLFAQQDIRDMARGLS